MEVHTYRLKMTLSDILPKGVSYIHDWTWHFMTLSWAFPKWNHRYDTLWHSRGAPKMKSVCFPSIYIGFSRNYGMQVGIDTLRHTMTLSGVSPQKEILTYRLELTPYDMIWHSQEFPQKGNSLHIRLELRPYDTPRPRNLTLYDTLWHAHNYVGLFWIVF